MHICFLVYLPLSLLVFSSVLFHYCIFANHKSFGLCRYVVQKDTKNNVVFVSRNYYSVDKRRRVFRVGSLKWLSGLLLNNVSELQCKVKALSKKCIFESIIFMFHVFFFTFLRNQMGP